MQNAIPVLAILLLLAGCDGRQAQTQATASTIEAAPATHFGHVAPIQLPMGEYFEAFRVTPRVWSGSSQGGDEKAPERYFFSTTTNGNAAHFGTHILRDGKGVPVMIVRDPRA